MIDIASLIADHKRLEGLSTALLQIATNPRQDAAGGFLVLRELTCELDAHLAVEDAAIYAKALSGRDGGMTGACERFEQDFADLTEEWAVYLREWTMENIEEDWAGFGHATRWMMERLQERIEAENGLLLPRAVEAGLLCRKAA